MMKAKSGLVHTLLSLPWVGGLDKGVVDQPSRRVYGVGKQKYRAALLMLLQHFIQMAAA